MAQVIGVRFREVGKVYYFPLDNKFEKGDHVIVETVRGMECGEVALENSEVSDEEIVKPLKSVVRRATDADLKIVEENRKKEQEAFDICLQKIADHGLDMMKLVNVEYAFDGKKILFYYTSDVRVDFRELVKDLARVFRTRIELRQIGVRDGSKMLGGLGMCGRPFCCSTFIGDFQPVSIKMAKEQGLSLNPVKISGTCGRLMCCLKYEQDNYEYLLKITPKQGALVDTPEGRGTVVEVNLLSGQLKVRLDRCPDAAPHSFNRREVKTIKDGKIKVDRSELEALKGIE
jgi:cell fate regulator YaaT (PSP1 superfamily)